jgi:hypothetical protein
MTACNADSAAMTTVPVTSGTQSTTAIAAILSPSNAASPR